MITIDNLKEQLLKNYQELKKYWEIAYHSTAIRIAFFSIFAIITIISLIPLTFDNSLLKFSLIQKVSKISEADFDINGDVEVALFPSPSITINDAVLLNLKHQPNFVKQDELYNFYAKKIIIKFSLTGLLGEEKINSIEFEDGFFESFSDPQNIPPRNNKITEILIGYKKLPAVSPNESGINISSSIFKISSISDSDMQFFLKKVPLIKLRNCSFSIFNKIGKNKDFEKINTNFHFAKKVNYGSGSFVSEKVHSKFSYQAIFNVDSSKPKSHFYLSSPNLELKIKGNYLEENKGLLTTKFKGNVSLKINELKSFYQTYFANEKSNIFSKLRSNNNSIQITSDIDNEAHELNFNDIKIDSNIISGSGDLYFAVDQKTPKLDINLDLENIDLDSIISQDALKIEGYNLDNVLQGLSQINDQEKLVILDKKNQNELANNSNDVSNNNPLNNSELITEKNENNNNKNTLNNDYNLINEIKDFDINADVKIKNLTFFENNFKDSSFYFNINKTGEILISPIIIKTPGEGSLYIRGSITDTQTIPKFIGIIDFKGKNFNELVKWLKFESNKIKFDNIGSFRFYANLFMVPNYSALDEIYFNINNNETEIFGNSKLIHENKNSTIITDLEFSSLDLNKYLKNIYNDNFLFNKESLIKKVLWLNNLNSNTQISINFNHLKYKQEEFNNQKIKLNLNRGYFNIDKLHLFSNETDLNVDLRIDIADKIPTLDLKLYGSKFAIFDGQVHDENTKLDEANKDKKITSENNNEEKNNLINISNLFKNKSTTSNIFDKFYNLPSLENFNGGIEINLREFEYNLKKITDLKFKGDFKNGTIDDTILSYKDNNGEVIYKGILDLKNTKIINGNLVIKNMNLNNLLIDLANIKIIEGLANINANILSVATNPKDFFKDLKSEIKFGISQPVIQGIGINNLISKLFNPLKNANELQEPEKIIFDNSSKTIYKQAKGSIIFNNSNEGKLKIELNGSAINSILAGNINPIDNNFDLQLNSVFLAVNNNKTTPINLAIKIKGSPQQFTTVANTNQVRQYLGLGKQNYQNKFEKQQNSIENNNTQQQLTIDNNNQDNSIKNNENNISSNQPEIKKEITVDKSVILPENNQTNQTEKNEEFKIEE